MKDQRAFLRDNVRVKITATRHDGFDGWLLDLVVPWSQAGSADPGER